MSLGIEQFAIILLIGHSVAAFFILSVLRRQHQLLKQPIEKYYRTFRIGLFILSCIIFLGIMVPIVIDSLTLFVQTQRPPRIYTISLIYASSNMVRDIASAIVIWMLYRISASSNRD